MGTDSDDSKYASQILRAMVQAAKGDKLYVLGVELGDEHADLVCMMLGETDDIRYLVPVARLLHADEIDKLKLAFGGDFLDDSNAGHA